MTSAGDVLLGHPAMVSFKFHLNAHGIDLMLRVLMYIVVAHQATHSPDLLRELLPSENPVVLSAVGHNFRPRICQLDSFKLRKSITPENDVGIMSYCQLRQNCTISASSVF
jgi:hypothetical protein